MEVSFVPGIIFVEEGGTGDSTTSVSLDMRDQNLFASFVLEENILVEQRFCVVNETSKIGRNLILLVGLIFFIILN